MLEAGGQGVTGAGTLGGVVPLQQASCTTSQLELLVGRHCGGYGGPVKREHYCISSMPGCEGATRAGALGRVVPLQQASCTTSQLEFLVGRHCGRYGRPVKRTVTTLTLC